MNNVRSKPALAGTEELRFVDDAPVRRPVPLGGGDRPVRTGAARLLSLGCVACAVVFMTLFALLIYAILANNTALLAGTFIWLPRVGVTLMIGVCILSVTSNSEA